MKLLVINGPNLNMLGLREPDIYGKQTYADLEAFIRRVCENEGIVVDIYQSNHEGALVDTIQNAYQRYDGIVINPAAYTHTSIAILDALKAVSLPAVEVHLSDVTTREPFRQISYAGMACIKTFMGLGFDGYRNAILYLKNLYTKTATSATNTSSRLKQLWYSGSEIAWKNAFNGYFDFLREEQYDIELYMNALNPIEISSLSPLEFYNFLYHKYFVWKYTQKNRLATTRAQLEKYIKKDELSKLGNIQSRIFSANKDNIRECLHIASEIYGLGTAGASGLLSILFPAYFGTVDQFVVKSLSEIDHVSYKEKIQGINPEGISLSDGELLIKIMRKKADELNNTFHTDFWTPRKIDMILWSFNR